MDRPVRTISLTEQAAAVTDYLDSIGRPRLVVVSLAVDPYDNVAVQLADRVPSVPWTEESLADKDDHPHVWVEQNGVPMRVITTDRKGLDNA